MSQYLDNLASKKENSNFSDSSGKKYQVSTLSYPENIDSTTEYGKNKVVFFINVSTAGAIGKAAGGNSNSGLYDVPVEDQQNMSGTKVIQKGLNATADAAGAAARAVGTVTGVASDIVSKASGGEADSTPIDSKAIEDGIRNLNSGNVKRLKEAICLYVPNSIRSYWSVSWSEESAESLSKGLFNETNSQTATALMEGTNGSGVKKAAKIQTSSAISKILADKLYLQRASKTSLSNSKSEQLFRGVDYREFEFSYSFSPKSETEARNVLNIIRKFRHHMLPEFKDDAQFMFIYPSEFNIKYYKGDKENEFIEKQMTSVLTRLNVDYTPNGQFNTFDNGMPTQINMTMTFKELGLVTKETAPEDKVGL